MKLCQSIYDHPEQWRLTEYCLIHDNGAAVWIANGYFFCAPYPGGHTSLLDKWRLWQAFRWWQRQAPVEAYSARRGKP